MAGEPDPKPERRQKPARRGRDPLAVKAATLADRECWGCGRDGANGHHLIPRDFVKPGPDEPWNIINLCGSGTMLCHGAFHGNPFIDERSPHRPKITPAIVRRNIAARLLEPAEEQRLAHVLAFLGDPALVVRFFWRVLDEPIEAFKQATLRGDA